jgi:PAS domain S-box-containing protein
MRKQSTAGKIQTKHNKLKNKEETIKILREGKQRVEQISSISPSIISVFDCKKQKNTYQNRSFLRILGYSKNEIEKFAKSKYPVRSKLIHPDDIAAVNKSIKSIPKMKDAKTYVIDYRVRDAKGKWQWVRNSSSVFKRDKNAKPAEILLSHDIITEQKNAEKELSESEKKFRSIFENANDVIVIVDTKGKILEINNNVEKMTGIPREKIIGKNFFNLKLFSSAEIRRLKSGFKQIIKSELNRSSEKKRDFAVTELRIKAMNGDTKYVSASTSALRTGDKLTGFLSIVHDITQRKKAEEENRRANELLEKIALTSPSIITVFDLRRKYSIFENKSILKLLGYPENEFERIENLPHKERIKAIIHPEDLKQFNRFYKEAGNIKGNRIHEMEFRVRDYWGSWKWFRRTTAVFKRNSKGIAEQVISVFENITGKKLSEETLKKSEEFNRAINQNAPIGISVRSASGKLLSSNKAWKKIWAKSDKNIFEDMTRERKELTFDEHDNYLNGWKSKVREVHEKGGSLFIPELKTGAEKKNRTEWVSKYFYAIKNKSGKVDRVVILTVDITERKRAELSLIETKQLLEKIASTSPAIIAVSDINTATNIYQNRSILEMLGYSKKEIRKISMNQDYIYNYLIHQDDLPRIRAFDKKINTLEDNRNYEIEYRLKDCTGGWQWIKRVCRVFQRDEENIPSQIVSIFENINKRKNAEHELRESEETAQALLNTITETVFMMDTSGKILSMNDTAAQRLLKSKDDLIGKNIFDLFPDSVWEQRKQKLKETIEFKKPIRHIDERNGKYFDTLGYPVFNKDNKINKIIVFAKDITEQIEFENVLRESEERYRNLIESSPDAIIVHLDGKILFANNSSARILGYSSPADLLNKNAIDFLHPDLAKTVSERISKIIDKGESVPFIEEKFRKADGSYIDVEVSARPYYFKGKTAVQVIARDISYRKEAEKALRESEERYKTLFDSANDSIFIIKNNKFTDCNRSAVKMFGMKKEDIIGKTPFELSPELQPDGKKSVEKGTELLKKVAREETLFFEWQHIDSQRKLFEVEVSLNSFKLGEEVYIQAIVRNITERKQAENQLRKLTSAVEQSPVSVVIADTKGDIEYVNPKFTEITQYSFDEVIGKNPRFLKSGNKSTEEYKELWDTITSGREWEGEFHNKKKNGELFWEYALITPLKTDKGTISNYLAIKQDITEQKIIDEKLRHSLKEKEVMLREIHHRVKNNLQIISSMLKLQSGYTDDPVASEYLKISQNRVKTMALIHQQLYRSDDLGGINFEEYMKILIKNLFDAYGIKTADISTEIRSKNILLGIDKAIPCGLIINELVSNSLKHAFTHSSKGIIKIEMQEHNNEYLMTISDNGSGIPENIDYRNTQTLGMQLVMTLIDQLDGKINLENKAGSKFILTFPVGL